MAMGMRPEVRLRIQMERLLSEPIQQRRCGYCARAAIDSFLLL